MKAVNSANKTCVESLKILGDFWTLRIVDSLRLGEMRFCELQRSAGNVNPVTLTNKLHNLEKNGLIKRIKESQDKISVSYTLTSLGKDVIPILEAVHAFSKKWKGSA